MAFLDIRMREMKGTELAKKLKLHSPKTDIIFTTGYTDYMGEAFKLHVSDYILKPITREKIEAEINELRYHTIAKNDKKLHIQTFGNFEIFVDNKPIDFKYSKTKELLAYIVDRQGALVTNGEIMGILWEDQADPDKKVSYLKNLKTDLLTELKKHNCDNIIVKQ